MFHHHWWHMYREEFRHYNAAALQRDVIAGINVAAVALPLALAFGVVAGASAAAGLVSAIWAGLIIGMLSGAPYQISGPTGAMGAVLAVLVQKYGLTGMWTAALMAGALLTLIGVLRLGRFITFIPSPVVTGFTSGIAVLIIISQMDPLLGVQTPRATSALFKVLGYAQHSFVPDWHTLMLGGLAALVMGAWPAAWQARVPGSLMGIGAATVLALILQWPVKTIGLMPPTLVLPEHLTLATIPFEHLSELVPPALTLAVLAALVSLLSGTSASALTGLRLHANQELIGQGLGNLVLPFFGAVPATGAVARTVVGIRAGGQTRVVSVVHSLVLLLCLLGLGPLLARVPLAALSGVLLVTCWRMNDWPTIQYIFGRRFKTAMTTFIVTVLSTLVFDLTQTVLLGVFISGAVFLNQIADIHIDVQDVDPEKLRQRGIENMGRCRHVRVAYITGPLFFAAAGNFNEAFAHVEGIHALVLSVRGMPLIDASGLQVLGALQRRTRQAGTTLMIAGAAEPVLHMLERSGLAHELGPQNIFWSSDQAIVEAERRGCVYCAREGGEKGIVHG